MPETSRWETEKTFTMLVQMTGKNELVQFHTQMPGGDWEMYGFHIENFTFEMYRLGDPAKFGTLHMQTNTEILKPEEHFSLRVTLDSTKLNMLGELDLRVDEKGGRFELVFREPAVGAEPSEKLKKERVRCPYVSKKPDPISGALITKQD